MEKKKKKNKVEREEKPKVLLFCDNPMCFATHIAKKHIKQEDKK